jgi:hypothetical protein
MTGLEFGLVGLGAVAGGAVSVLAGVISITPVNFHRAAPGLYVKNPMTFIQRYRQS